MNVSNHRGRAIKSRLKRGWLLYILMVLSNIYFQSFRVMRVPELWLVFCKCCFDTHVTLQRNLDVSLRKHSFTYTHAAPISVLSPHPTKCDLPMALGKTHYHSLRLQQQGGPFIFSGRITRHAIFHWC